MISTFNGQPCKKSNSAPTTDIGATSLTQLQENVDAYAIKLSDEVINAVNAIHTEIMNPGQ